MALTRAESSAHDIRVMMISVIIVPSFIEWYIRCALMVYLLGVLAQGLNAGQCTNACAIMKDTLPCGGKENPM